MDRAKLALDVLKISCQSDTSECQLMNAKLAANTLGLSLFGFKTHIYDKIDISSVCICNICGDIQTKFDPCLAGTLG